MKIRKIIFYLILVLGFANCDGPNSSEKKAIKEAIENAYLNLMTIGDENNLQQPFYNPNLGSSFALLLSPVFLNGTSISAENIEIVNFIDDATAEVKYQLHVKKATEEKQIEVSMIVKKVGGMWKLDSEKFLPKHEVEDSGNVNNEAINTEAKRIVDSILAASSNTSTNDGDVEGGTDFYSQGTISGKVGYPSEFVPEDVNVYAHDINTNDVIKHTSIDRSTGAYIIEVPDGEYYIFSGKNNNVNDKSNGFYSKMVPCGLSVQCHDHTLIKVIISGGNEVKNIDTGDWFMQ